VRNGGRIAPNQLPQARAVEETYTTKIQDYVLTPIIEEFANLIFGEMARRCLGLSDPLPPESQRLRLHGH